MALLALPSLALADPDSPFFSQPAFNQQSDQQMGPWYHSQVNIPQISGNGITGSSAVDLSAVSAGQGVTTGGNSTSMQALDEALSVPLTVVGAGVGGTGPLGTAAGAGGFSAGAVGAGAAVGALGALGAGLGGIGH